MEARHDLVAIGWRVMGPVDGESAPERTRAYWLRHPMLWRLLLGTAITLLLVLSGAVGTALGIWLVVWLATSFALLVASGHILLAVWLGASGLSKSGVIAPPPTLEVWLEGRVGTFTVNTLLGSLILAFACAAAAGLGSLFTDWIH